MIVVAIVAVVAALLAPNFTKHQDRGKVESAVRLLRSKIEHARLVAGELGPQIGDPNAGASWNYGTCTAPAGACPGAVPGYVWITLDSLGNYSIPNSVTISAAGTVTLTCDNGTLTTLMQQANVTNTLTPGINPAASPMCFSFTATGRRYVPPGGQQDIFYQMTNPQDGKSYGFRVFPSGVLCTINNPTAGAPQACDSD
jgi:type II secretory pathway pseudopilin PulG